MLKRSILFKKNNLPLRQIIKKRMTKSIFLIPAGDSFPIGDSATQTERGSPYQSDDQRTIR